jgi:polyisoprenyl-phosphate glycosyltransferase
MSSPAGTLLYSKDPRFAKIRQLQGPILVLGASGFIGANLLRMLLEQRSDVYGTATRRPAWRLEDLPGEHVLITDLLIDTNVDALLADVKPRTIFDCIAYGAYPFETDRDLIYRTNFNLISSLLSRLDQHNLTCYVHAGSSSEYGDNASSPHEDSRTMPNSHYSVSKVAAASLIQYLGRKKGLPCVNLRLYSAYGPLEDSSRLIPNIIRYGASGGYPELVDPRISRDFVYVDDAVEAFIDAALNLRQEDYGESFNVGTGCKTTIGDIATIAKRLFNILQEPAFTMPNREWDLTEWCADVSKVRDRFGWEARVGLEEGLQRTANWYQSLPDKAAYLQSSKKFGLDTKHSITAIIACYRDAQAIPIMYARLKKTFADLNVDHEIIFVNDCSPDDSEEIIRAISRNDRRVLGISHSRNFGSQSAFRSGMEIATKNSCVLLDGDLQDPPELIEQFVSKWREGYDVVFGRRVKREASLPMQMAYKLFYRIFDAFSYIRIPHDAGDFSLIDRRVVEAMLRFPERDLFLRGVRAYAGFRQIGVDYVRPERMFGRTTNSFWKNLGWAKKGILSFSYVPLDIMSSLAIILCSLSALLILGQLTAKLFFPNSAPHGFASTIILIIFFGSLNVLAISIAGEYIAKIFEEVKQRPHYIRRSIIRDGEVRLAAKES